MLRSVSIERRKLFQLVAEHLEGLIIAGELKPGDQLPPERELQTAFGVGRPAVREALITLERSGLIEIGNGAPARVARPSGANLLSSIVPTVRHLLSTNEGRREFQAIRMLVEIGLVRRAARDATPEFVAELSEALASNEAARDDVEAFIYSDVHFHFVIARFAGEPGIVMIHQSLAGWLSEQRAVSLRAQGAVEDAIRHHRNIFAAIEARDPDAAEKAMQNHLEEVRQTYWKQVNGS